MSSPDSNPGIKEPQQRKRKVMHITHGLGGIQTYLENILVYSHAANFDYIIAAPYNRPFQSFCANRAKYYPLKIGREIRLFGDIALLVRLIRIVRKEKPDVLHVHSAKAGFLGRLAGKFSPAKVIYTPHGFSYLSFTGTKRMLFFTLECLVRNSADLLVAVSVSEANRARFEVGFNREKVVVVPNAVDPNGNIVERNYENNHRIGMIGRLTIQKNPMLFLEIAKTLLQEYPYLQFRLLGAGLDDHLGTHLSDFIRNNNLQAKIQLLPWGDANTGAAFLRDTDIYLTTSVFEGLPFSLLEAMRSACACVVSEVDGNADLIRNNENGFSCLAPEDFCSRIEMLINSRELRERFGKAARRDVKEKNDIFSAIAHLERVYMTV